MGKGIYTASKTQHAEKWLALRKSGWPIVSTWIDEADDAASPSLTDLWIRCVREASSAAVLLLYVLDGEQLKGALVEVGAALASGVPVVVVGPVEASWKHHPLVRLCGSLDDALDVVNVLM